MTGSAARPMFAPVRSRKEVLSTSTIREFDGGWNVIDSDLNLSSKFAKILENMYRAPDGANTIRFGTKLFGRIDVQSATTGTLGNNPLATTNGSAVVRVTQSSHGLISGHSNTLAGLTATNGIPAGELNATHVVTVVTANSYDITVATSAGSTGVGGDAAGTFSHNNKQLTGDIVNKIYFQDRLVIVDDNGEIVEMDSNGIPRVIWNTAIAVKLIGSPNAWSLTDFVSFAVFGGELIICNGVDKPLLADFTRLVPASPVQFLQDIPSGANINVPIARYVLAMDHYVLMAGDPTNVGLIHISNTDTSGTWLGDAGPNDATTIDLAKVTTSDNFTIRGLGRHRDRVVAAFDDNSVLGQLGIFDGAVHKPAFSDVIEQHGSISHRAMQSLGNDLLMCDIVGVPSISRALFTGTLRPDRVSELVDPEIQKALLALNVGSTEDRVFAVYNQREGQYMLFIPNANTIAATTETKCFVYTSIKSIKLKAWSLYRGWNFSCATRSALNRIFFGAKKKVYVYGAIEDLLHGDFINDPDIADPTNGTPIAFIWELPWADFDRRIHVKTSRYISFDTKGTATFTAKMFVDNVYEDKLNPGTLLPTLTTTFVGGDSPGYGGGSQPYGGGRRTSDARLWSWTAKFEIAKLRFDGATTEPLSFIAVTLAYQDGSIRR